MGRSRNQWKPVKSMARGGHSARHRRGGTAPDPRPKWSQVPNWPIFTFHMHGCQEGVVLLFFFFFSRELSSDQRSNRIGSRHIGFFLIFSWNVRTSSVLRGLPRSHLSFDRVLGCRTPCFKFYISLRMYTALCNWVCAPPLYTWTLSTVWHKTPFEGILGPKVRRELSLDTLKHAWRHGFQGRLMLCLCQPYVTLKPSKAEVYPPKACVGL